jgi:hypothetical protein
MRADMPLICVDSSSMHFGFICKLEQLEKTTHAAACLAPLETLNLCLHSLEAKEFQ